MKNMPLRKVCFLIPASPTAGFMSQIAAFRLAMTRLQWVNWQPSILVCFGEEMNAAAHQAYERWRPYLRDVIFVIAPEVTPNPHYGNQIDGVLRWAPKDADVLVRMDADTLILGDVEPTLDLVLEQSAIAGTIALHPFPSPPGSDDQAMWELVAQDFVTTPVPFKYRYSYEPNRSTPFYVNDGCVFFSREYFDKFVPLFLETRSKVELKLFAPYFSGQVALALSAMRVDLPAIALPLRYNFPNHELAAVRFPGEMDAAIVLHYWETSQVDRQQIFQTESSYSEFLSKPLNQPNERFRSGVIRQLGQTFPFSEPAID